MRGTLAVPGPAGAALRRAPRLIESPSRASFRGESVRHAPLGVARGGRQALHVAAGMSGKAWGFRGGKDKGDKKDGDAEDSKKKSDPLLKAIQEMEPGFKESNPAWKQWLRTEEEPTFKRSRPEKSDSLGSTRETIEVESEPSIPEQVIKDGVEASISRLTFAVLYGVLSFALLAIELGIIPGGCRYSMLLPWIISFNLSLLCGAIAIPLLKRAEAWVVMEPRNVGGKRFQLETPTMGGVSFIPVGVGVGCCLLGTYEPVVTAVGVATMAFFGVGVAEDLLIMRGAKRNGLPPRVKLGLQVLVGILFSSFLLLQWETAISGALVEERGMYAARMALSRLESIALPFGHALLLGKLYWLLSTAFVMANAVSVSITDGMDGLAGVLCACAFWGMGIVMSPFPEMAYFCLAMSGACFGFLFHNRFPAKIVMGDAGALPLGAALGLVAVATRGLIPGSILSALFFLEALSVGAQLLAYRFLKGKDGKPLRLMRQAPLHFHMGITGTTERGILVRFLLAQLIACVVAISYGWKIFPMPPDSQGILAVPKEAMDIFTAPKP